jgi:general secretion pathway protein K
MIGRQRGVALITAMLILAIVATLATSLALGQQVWLRQTQNLVDLAQAERLRQGALEFAAVILERDARNSQTSGADHLGEDWARPIPPLPVEGGAVLISIADAQGRFNLNNLVQVPQTAQGQSQASPPAGKGTPPQSGEPLFRKLLELNGLDPNLADTLIDWLDGDSNARPNGAEDLDYLNHDPPYRAANQPLMSVDELHLVKGYTDDVVEKLRPYVVALPASSTLINVNTASARVIAALTNSDVSQAEQIVRLRETRPFKSNSDFLVLLGPNPPFTGGWGIISGYFIVSVETRIGRTQQRTEALIDRSSGNAAKALWYRIITPKIVLDEEKT